MKDFATEFKVMEAKDLFKWNEAETEANKDLLTGINEYLKIFAFPTSVEEGYGVCIKCGERWNGMLAAIGAGYAVRWGIVHGEGECSKCHWPVRGMHYPKDKEGKELFSLQNGFLCYHPDSLVEVEAE